MGNKHNSIIVNQIKKTLVDGGYTCVIAKDEQVYTSNVRGVKPLLDWLDEGVDLKGASAADKVVGKAAAYLYVLLGVKFVYASVISKLGLSVFEKYGIDIEYDVLVDAIENRTKTGFCPMERAVWDLNEPEKVPEVLKTALAHLAKCDNQEPTAFSHETVKQWAICQIEDKRAELVSEKELQNDDNQVEQLNRQLEILNDEKRRRGYKV